MFSLSPLMGNYHSVTDSKMAESSHGVWSHSPQKIQMAVFWEKKKKSHLACGLFLVELHLRWQRQPSAKMYGLKLCPELFPSCCWWHFGRKVIASWEKAKWPGFMTYCLVCHLQGSISLPPVLAGSGKSSTTYYIPGNITGDSLLVLLIRYLCPYRPEYDWT